MASPSGSPEHNLQGASRITGGILRGRADGNVFNFADANVIADKKTPIMGKIHLYTSPVNPTTTPPTMSLNHAVVPALAPILSDLAERFSPVRSMLFSFFDFPLLIIFVEENQRIWVFEDDSWNIKGRFATAVKANEDVTWMIKDRKYIFPLLIVCA
jgi:hypothetical protein